MSQTRYAPSHEEAWRRPSSGRWPTMESGYSQSPDYGRAAQYDPQQDGTQSSGYYNPRLGIVRPLNKSSNQENHFMEPLLIDTGSAQHVNGSLQSRTKEPYAKQFSDSFEAAPQYPAYPNQDNYGGTEPGWYQSRTGQEMEGGGGPYHTGFSRPIDPIKEDPDMGDDEILTSKKLSDLRKHLANQRYRLSISANDLLGKSHEELVLLLIQLRRNQAKMENLSKFLNARLELVKARVSRNRQLQFDEGFKGDEYCKELEQQRDEVNRQLDVIKPLVHLLHNMVTMGSVYGGDNLMLASQYKQHKLRPGEYTPPRKMIEFSRNHQEEQLLRNLEQEMNTLSKEEIDLEKKLTRLYDLDHLLQQTSMTVSSLQEDKMLLEKALESCVSQEGIEVDPGERKKLKDQRLAIESELSKARQQLVESSRKLEEIATENAKAEHEFILLRKKIYGLDQSKNSGRETPQNEDSLKVRYKIERELSSIQSVMEGLSKQREKLSEVMDSLKVTPPSANGDINQRGYMETDLDTLNSKDIGLSEGSRSSPNKTRTEVAYRTSSLPSQSSRKRQDTDEGYALNSYSSAYDDQENEQPNYYDQRPKIATPSLNPQRNTNPALNADFRNNPNGMSPHFREPPARGSGAEYPQKPVSAVQPLQQSGQPLRNQLYSNSDVFYREEAERYSQGPAAQPASPADSGQNSSFRSSSSLTRWKGLHSVVAEENPEFGQNPNVHHTGQRHTPTYPVEQRVNSYPENQGTSQNYSQYQRHTPTFPQDQRRTPTFPPDQRQTPTFPPDQRQTPTFPPDQTQSPTFPPQNIPPERRHTASFPIDQRQTHSYPDQQYHQNYPPDQRLSATLPSDQRQFATFPSEQRQFASLPSDPRHTSPYPSDPGHTSAYPYDERQSATLPPPQRQTLVSQSDDRYYSQQLNKQPQSSIYTSDPSLHWDRQQQEGMTQSGRHPQQPSPRAMAGNQMSPGSQGQEDLGLYGPLTPQGISSREKAKLKTVRDVKKNEIERRSRDRVASQELVDNHPLRRARSLPGAVDQPPIRHQSSYHPPSADNTFDRKSTQRSSAAARLFPQGHRPAPSPSFQSPQERIRRMSDLYTPRPYASPAVTTVTPPETVAEQRGAVLRAGPRGRSMTISSSRPLQLEQQSQKAVRSHSVAGDLISMRPSYQADVVRTKTTDDLAYDDTTIDREVLFVPEKVFIPERYIPESEEEVSDSEMMKRQDKAERIRKMLAAHSLQEFGRNEFEYSAGHMHSAVEQEKKRREHLLDLKHELAKQVTYRSKQVAEMQMHGATESQ